MRAPTRESGFTLPELLISIAILAIIMGTLGSALIVTFTDTATKLRVSEAHDKQIAGVYWAPDVASSEGFTTATAQCSVPSGTLVVGMSWTDDNGLNKVDYILAGSGATKTLYRYSCIGSGTTSRLRIADQVVSASCSPACSSLTSTSPSARLVLSETSSTINVDGTRRIS